MSLEFDNEKPSEKERLSRAKATFRKIFLDDDTSFGVVAAITTKGGDGSVDGLPDFGIEPTLLRNDDETSNLGLRINCSMTGSGGFISATVAVFEYVPLAQLNRTTGEAKLSEELEEALASMGKAKKDGLAVLQAWQVAATAMGQEFDGELVIDPASNTFELASELEGRNYSTE